MWPIMESAYFDPAATFCAFAFIGHAALSVFILATVEEFVIHKCNFIFVGKIILTFYVKNTSLKKVIIAGRNMWQATPFIIQ